MSEAQEVHVERLLGQSVHDADGRRIGRLEELLVEMMDGEWVVTEFHIGGAALLERVAAFVTMLPFLRLLPFGRKGYRARGRMSTSRILGILACVFVVTSWLTS